MVEMEKIVGEVGRLVAQLAGDEDEATARAVERTRRAFQFLRSARQATRNGKDAEPNQQCSMTSSATANKM